MLNTAFPIKQFLFFIFVFCITGSDSNLFAQAATNSMRKIRVKPNESTLKIGSTVRWSNDFQEATQQSKNSGKPIFWYVPTIPGTFMDRKVEIDRYMMAGPFSWPPIIEILNNHFVPLRLKPDEPLQKRFELSRYKFVEPGFLIIKGENSVTKVDQITTHHYGWWQQILTSFCNEEFSEPAEIVSIRKRFLDGNVPFQIRENVAERWSPYEMYFGAMAKFRLGDHHGADQIWRMLMQSFPSHSLAWKSSAELQRLGPFCRGFEVHVDIPQKSLRAGIQSRGTRAPAGTFSLPQLWKRSTQFLLSMQNESGAFLDSDYDFGGTDSLPNVHVAVTSLVGLALIESSERAPEIKNQIQTAVDRCFNYVTDEKNLNRIDRDEILWADAYRLRFIARYAAFTGKNVRRQLAAATNALENLQSKRGNWYHEYENSFVTATALIALMDAKTSGVDVDSNKIDKGLRALKTSRFANGAYPYSAGRRGVKNPDRLIPGAAGRMPLCEMALSKWGYSDQTALVNAIRISFEHQQNLDVALKYDNHTSTHAYGGFFFWYDMRARCEAISSVQDVATKKTLAVQQLQIVKKLPEIDGCFVDSHELGRCYGTAMAMLCLANIESQLSD